MARRSLAVLSLWVGCGTPPSTDAVDTDIVDTDVADTDVADTDVPDTDVADTDVEDTEVPGCAFRVGSGPAGEALAFDTSGCWTVRVDLYTITFRAGNEANKVEIWGDPHENLNGKHIKDWLGDRRTVLLPGGVIVTLHADGPQGVVTRVSLYDGSHVVQINTAQNEITLNVDDADEAAAMEAAEADGEASRVTELGDDRVSWDNEYTQGEDEEGVPGPKEPTPAQLGVTGGTENPNNVRDFFDDPRLGHT